MSYLDGDSWSLRESEVRALLVFAGLSTPESNVGAGGADDQARIGDLVYRRWGVVVEYEGEHHQLDRAQYVKDIDRYASMRRDSVPYVQVTKEKLERPRRLVVRSTTPWSPGATTDRAPSSVSAGGQLFARLSDVVAAERRWVSVGSRR